MDAKLCKQVFDINNLRRQYEIFCEKYIHKWAVLNYDIACSDVLYVLFDSGL